MWDLSWLYFLSSVCSLSCISALLLFWLISFIRRRFSWSRSSASSLIREGLVTMKNVTISLYYADYDDLPAVYDMENKHAGNLAPCTWEEFYHTMTNGWTCCVVAKDQTGKLHGYMVYGVRPEDVFIGSLVVAPESRRHGLGSEIVRWFFTGSLQQHRRPLVTTYARESALGWQQFLSHNGFVCTRIIDDAFVLPDEHCYFFERYFHSEEPVNG